MLNETKMESLSYITNNISPHKEQKRPVSNGDKNMRDKIKSRCGQ